MILNIAEITIAVNNVPKDIRCSTYIEKVLHSFSADGSINISHTMNLTPNVKAPTETTRRQNADYFEDSNRIFIESDFFKISIDRNLKKSQLFLKETNNPPFYLLKAIKLVLSFIVIQKGGIPMHSSAVVSNDHTKGFAFTGPSNSGKTTIALLLSIAENEILNDEFNILLPAESGIIIYSTPFTTEDKLVFCNNYNIPLRGIFLLKKSSKNFISKQHPSKNYFKLIESAYSYPATEKLGNMLLQNIESISKHIEPVLLYFRNDSSIIEDFDSFSG